MRFLLICLEFADPIFSGNGVLSRVYASQLAAMGNHVDVLCGVPSSQQQEVAQQQQQQGVKVGWISETSRSEQQQHQPSPPPPPIFAAVPVPESKWRRLDHHAAHAEFAAGCVNLVVSTTSQAARDVNEAIFTTFTALRQKHFGKEEDEEDVASTPPRYDTILFVDWHGFVAFHSIREMIAPPPHPQSDSGKLIYLNFRVFCNKFLGDVNSEEFQFYRSLETRAMRAADRTLVLSHTDRDLLLELMMTNAGEKDDSDNNKEQASKMGILAPPLQPAFLERCRAFVLEPSSQFTRTSYRTVSDDPAEQDDESCLTLLLTCCVRLDRTKGAHIFANLVEFLAKKNNNQEDKNTQKVARPFSLVRLPSSANVRVIPFLCGAAADPEYAAAVKSRILSACRSDPSNCIIRDDFVSSAELTDIWHNHAVLNIHPALYDAYGMSVVESAAAGTMTLTHGVKGGSSSPVGASDFMRAEHGELLLTDLTRPIEQVAAVVEPLLVRLVEFFAKSNADSSSESSSEPELASWHRAAQSRALSYGPEAAVHKLLDYCV